MRASKRSTRTANSTFIVTASNTYKIQLNLKYQKGV